ncbi:hypothetical protein MN116_001125 [Schistosoma mekongi]|uniref:BHLH domain-containing protein n=1 Tax=Schistosoma mekongi TaxID=38744 RepID=A0AAE1ZKZ7_SCHME|nr:hypothetical protein MN116_001125 [Schistosoma mekongi]
MNSTMQNTLPKTTSSNLHKRIAANLRERKRMRLLNHAFSGLHSCLPKELLYSSAFFGRVNSSICTSFARNYQRFNMQFSDVLVERQLTKYSLNPMNSYFEKQSISKFGVLRAAINYIHILIKTLNDLNHDYSPEPSNYAVNQERSLKMSKTNDYDLYFSSPMSYSNKLRVNELNEVLTNVALIKTGKFKYLMVF